MKKMLIFIINAYLFLSRGAVALFVLENRCRAELAKKEDGMIKKGMVLGVLTIALAAPGVMAEEQADWQVNCDSCVSATAAGHQKYLQSCKDNDQFTAVLACFDGDGAEKSRSRSSILKAGRYSVNKYMAKKKPSQCK
jgi:hypothetical protein